MKRLFTPDPWLAETLARPVFKLASPQVSREPLSAEMAELSRQGDAFFYAKLPTSEVTTCMILSGAGFSVIDTGITFLWSGGKGAAPRMNISVGPVRPEQHHAVADIAARCFRWSRFHLDPRIPVKLANLVKRRWIENYCRGQRGAALYVGEIGDTIAGFLAVIESKADNRPLAIIDLIGVSPEHQGRGIGAALVRFFVDEWRGRVAELRVGTQAANIASLRFYERNGFQIVESNYVLHAHYQDGEICQ